MSWSGLHKKKIDEGTVCCRSAIVLLLKLKAISISQDGDYCYSERRHYSIRMCERLKVE